MPVEEKGETDVIITKELIEKEKAKLEELKAISAQKKKLVTSGRGTQAEKQESREAVAEAKKQKKLVKDLSDKLKKIEKQQKETDDKIKGFLGKTSSFLSDPKGAIADIVGELFQTSRAIPILGAAIGLGVVIFKLIEKEFGDGGLFDLRVRVKDIVRSIVGLKNLLDVEAGEVFMSPDTRLTTMPPETNNTESRRDGHVRYNQITLGYI